MPQHVRAGPVSAGEDGQPSHIVDQAGKGIYFAITTRQIGNLGDDSAAYRNLFGVVDIFVQIFQSGEFIPDGAFSIRNANQLYQRLKPDLIYDIPDRLEIFSTAEIRKRTLQAPP